MRVFVTAFAVGALLLFVQVNQAATLVTKQVNCSSNKTISDEVSNLDNDKAYLIEVSGTCTENVMIANYIGPSLQIVGTPSAILNGVNSTPPSSPLTVSASRRVSVSNFTVNPTDPPPGNPNGNINAILLALCSGCGLNNITVNAARLGVLINETQAAVSNITMNVTSAGTGMAIIQSSDVNILNYEATGSAAPMSFAALNVQGGSRVRLNYNTPKTLMNFQNAILVTNAASLEGPSFCGSFPLAIQNCLTIRNNSNGLRVSSAQVFQMGGVVFDLNGDAIWAENGSVVQLNPPLTITNSTGAFSAAGNGITATHNSHVSIGSFVTGGGAPPNLISGNDNRGIAVASGSTLQLGGLDADDANQIVNNGPMAASIDIACDATSLVTGTSTVPAATDISCVNSNTASIPLP